MTAGITFSVVAAMDDGDVDRAALSLKLELELLLEVDFRNEELDRESVVAMADVGRVWKSHGWIGFSGLGDQQVSHSFLSTISGSFFGSMRVLPDPIIDLL